MGIETLLGNMTITFSQCKEYYEPSSDTIFGFILFIILWLSVALLFFWMLVRSEKYRKFIKDSKLEKKYQEWQDDNRGLF